MPFCDFLILYSVTDTPHKSLNYMVYTLKHWIVIPILCYYLALQSSGYRWFDTTCDVVVP